MILLASQNGYGKLTEVSQFSTIGRGGQGVIAIKISERNGALVGASQVESVDEVLLISDQGTMVRTRVQEVSMQGRNTQGVRLINVGEDEHLVGMARIEDPVDSEVSDESSDDGEESESDSSAAAIANDPSSGPTVSFLQMSDDLAALRDAIDQLDAELLAKINERARLAEAVAEVKQGVAQDGEAPVLFYRPERGSASAPPHR